MKTACVIQGNIRSHAALVRDEMLKHFDLVILSTWKGEEGKVPNTDRCVILYNEKPSDTGFTHRNFQRFSTAQGLRKARELGYEWVMKWRTDMVPTRLDMGSLIAWAGENVPTGMASRIVTMAFRNLTVEPDWFSSIPDLFAFGRLEAMELLWGDEGFDYSQPMNIPEAMRAEVGMEWTAGNTGGGYYCAESELYAIFKDRLQRWHGRALGHEEIAKGWLRLVDHSRLGILWFGEGGRFRPIVSVCFPWWTEDTWLGKKSVERIPSGYPVGPMRARIADLQVKAATVWQNYRQRAVYARRYGR